VRRGRAHSPAWSTYKGSVTPDNILCPNHHVVFDHGGIALDDDLSLLGEKGDLTVHPNTRSTPENATGTALEHGFVKVRRWSPVRGLDNDVDLRCAMHTDNVEGVP
jgi:hypothetical protein